MSFTTDAWSSPNHRAYIAIAVHLIHNGEPISLILDVVEVAKVRLPCSLSDGAAQHQCSLIRASNLAEEFTHVLEEFSISDKVRVRAAHFRS